MNKTENQLFADKVAKGHFPEAPIVPLDDIFKDTRGTINNLLLSPVTSIARISSKKGTVRANHYHLTDWHYAFVESGEIYYFEREVGSQIVPDPQPMRAGMMFFTPPNVEHAMLFTQDTIFFTFAKNIRSHVSHESDLVRVSFITEDIAQRFL
jgi:quercetin dioxygenase-like cupin family protein